MSALPHPPRQNGCIGESWIAARLNEARTVIAEASAHSDHLLRLACNVVISHGEGETERAGARAVSRCAMICAAPSPSRA